MSSLKSSCRRLGLTRWPYTRFVSNESGSSFKSVLVESSIDAQPSAESSDTMIEPTENENHPAEEEGIQDEPCHSPQSDSTMIDGEFILDPKWISWYVNLDDADAEEL